MLPSHEQHHVEQRQRHDEHDRRGDPRPRARAAEARGGRGGVAVRRKGSRVLAKPVPDPPLSSSSGRGKRRSSSGSGRSSSSRSSLLSLPRLPPRRGLGQRRQHRRVVPAAADLALQEPATLEDPRLQALEVSAGDGAVAGAGADERVWRAGLEADAALGERERRRLLVEVGGGGGRGGRSFSGGLGCFFRHCCCCCSKGVLARFRWCIRRRPRSSCCGRR